MSNLKVDYADDVLDTSQNTRRKFNVINNPDGTISLEDVTEYLTKGDSFGAGDINETNGAINQMHTDLEDKIDHFTSGNYLPVTGLAYNPTTKKMGLKVDGADSVTPFSGGVKLVKLPYTNSFSVPVEVGKYYFGLFRRGGMAYGGYTVIKAFGTMEVVRATGNTIWGTASGDDSGYNSFTVSIYRIDGELTWTE